VLVLALACCDLRSFASWRIPAEDHRKTTARPKHRAESQPKWQTAIATPRQSDRDARKHGDMHDLVAGKVQPFAEPRFLEQHAARSPSTQSHDGRYLEKIAARMTAAAAAATRKHHAAASPMAIEATTTALGLIGVWIRSWTRAGRNGRLNTTSTNPSVELVSEAQSAVPPDARWPDFRKPKANTVAARIGKRIQRGSQVHLRAAPRRWKAACRPQWRDGHRAEATPHISNLNQEIRAATSVALSRTADLPKTTGIPNAVARFSPKDSLPRR